MIPDDPRWLWAGTILLASLLIGYLTRALVLRRLAKLFAVTKTQVDDLVLAAVRRYVPLWVLLVGVAIAARVAPLSDRVLNLAVRGCSLVFILSLAAAAAGFAARLTSHLGQETNESVAATTLIQNLVRTTIFGLAGLLVLGSLGISITPLLTALGIGSIAVALALQPTLSNLFAGIHIALARPIRVGDYVELESGPKGFVADITWRTTRIREFPNNIVIVPNARIAEMIVTNYDLPEPEQSTLVQVGVSYSSDLEHVERVVREVGREVLKDTKGGVAEFEPVVRYHTFGDSSINFSAVLRVKEFADRFPVTHEFIKRLKSRFDREGIEIPFPQRVLHGHGTPPSVQTGAGKDITRADPAPPHSSGETTEVR